MISRIIKIACFGVLIFFSLQAAAQDIISYGGTFTVSQDNGGGPNANEGSLKLVDNNPNTKIFVGGVQLPWYMQWACTTPARAAQYTMTSGNDDPTRDPKNWILAASNDAAAWTTIDTRTNETFGGRNETRTFDIPMANQAVYKYYRLTISAIGSGTNFQMSEWRLLEGLPPAAPTVLAGLATAGSEILLTWEDNASNESGFEIERSSNGTDFVKVGSVIANRLNFAATGLLVNTSYQFRVRAINTYGNSTYSNTIVISTLNQSGQLTDVTDDGGVLAVSKDNDGGPTSGEGSLKLIDNNYNSKFLVFGAMTVDGYWVRYRAQNPWMVTKYTITTANDAASRDPKTWKFQGTNDTAAGWTDLDSRTGVTFAGRNTGYTFAFANNTAYTYFRLLVLQNNGSGNIMGQISELEIWGMSPNAPKVPADLDVTAVTFITATLKWTDNSSNETGFEIEKSEDSLNFESAGTAPANSNTFEVTNLLGGFKYYFRIRAINASTRSIWSKVVDTITDYDPNLPLTPRNLIGVALSETAVNLTWDDRSGNETSFEIERSINGINFIPLNTVNANIVTYADNGLNLASRYYYRVRAKNGFGTSYYSNVVTVTTLGKNIAPTLDAITNKDICTTDSTFTFDLTGITTGAEAWQLVTLAVTSSDATLFDELSVTPVVNGKAQLSYNAAKGGTATITVRAQDNGATYNGGADTYTRTFTIVVNPLVVNIASDKGVVIPRLESAQLTASGAENYTWANAHGIESGQQQAVLTVRPTINTAYTVLGKNSRGCKDTATITIQLKGNYNLDPVNVITPNGDGKNDRWVIWNINAFPNNEVRVMDRAGRVVFMQKNYMNDWEGTYNGAPLPEGAYLYVIKLGPGIPPAQGVLTIIRNRK
ncbi:gliding motility-associated C-terminal domain-containing protein [Paraflavitalea sp. CAU 1676]|uniref:fibronectin type III domain-containing protein n=1 Tax=Paraflavitalea sp. CAU 1676 TaxID=3032598 RepID=UPI0023DA386B|nr:gliding motility-associated C-terminal domain-containing protein [Paraflavitalea sp. CAU 1676]MDF2190719.1 gliding motility-associated C-terminal domain-containing protein [Paraflavitalea sp. CAU 1676]